MTTPRSATVSRTTRETDIACTLSIDAGGRVSVRTGLGFLDHMLESLAAHAGFSLDMTCRGDLHIDDHHTVEDCALTLGAALDRCLLDRAGITRFGSAHAPLDESLARAVVDLSGRAFARIDLALTRDRLGDVSCENLSHFLSSLAVASRSSLHVDVLRGENDHHKVEAAFKAVALALRDAVRIRGSTGEIPSTKGVL